jgi:hypothetical protein
MLARGTAIVFAAAEDTRLSELALAEVVRRGSAGRP